MTSGGDAPGMNAAIRAFVRLAIGEGDEVLGIERGFEGMAEGLARLLTVSSVADILMRGGTMLRTSRYRAFEDPSTRERAFEWARQQQLAGLVVLGGNGSLAGAVHIAERGLPVVGIPSSIDGDVPGTDYTLGFDTAVNNITASMDKIRDTASAHERIFVVEVMGNRSGQLAVAAGLAGGAEAVIVPEIAPDYHAIARRLDETYARGKRHSFLVVAEGAARAADVAEEMRSLTGHEVKTVVLGHTQRGGPPSAHDRIMAALFAEEALRCLRDGNPSAMMALSKSQVVAVPLDVVSRQQAGLNVGWMALAERLAR
nr:ATP-dependent 6-phosphofructokinase [Sulfobacillus harzensis]